MEPNTRADHEVSFEDKLLPQAGPRVYRVVYSNILIFGYWHLGGLYGLYLCFTTVKWATILFNAILHVAAVWGVTAGAHRLWSHGSYKAKRPLQIILMLSHSLASQNTIIHWARDHRLHHKYSDTDADPHNATRGFFYSHIGWLLVKKHPEAIKKGKTLDVSDLYDNPILQFQEKYYLYLTTLLTFILPALIPVYYWGETLNNAHHTSILRLMIGFNFAFLVNSAAHKYGNKPYDKYMTPTQSVTLSLATLGEGYHNYHHVFPFDYRTSEFGNNYINLTTKLIDFMAWIGWAYDLKYASADLVMKRAKRTGDGTDLWGRKKNGFHVDQRAVAS
ncbi:acyl-CoA Delta(11) desaturase-like [Cydia amplana]|uniref:acyl-CoA Delta(11) desaturase-like n=1 Tax=Cydia amplana TaxID=1869771 RepID=UPI002FE59BC7